MFQQCGMEDVTRDPKVVSEWVQMTLLLFLIRNTRDGRGRKRESARVGEAHAACCRVLRGKTDARRKDR